MIQIKQPMKSDDPIVRDRFAIAARTEDDRPNTTFSFVRQSSFRFLFSTILQIMKLYTDITLKTSTIYR